LQRDSNDALLSFRQIIIRLLAGTMN
jgi:hypothetical protein